MKNKNETYGGRFDEAPMSRTSFGLRDALFDEWDMLRRGESTPQKASSIARMATAAINSVKMEIEYQKHVQTTLRGVDVKESTAVIQLGSKSNR